MLPGEKCMIRSSSQPTEQDALVALLRRTCYDSHAPTVASLVRRMNASYHAASQDDGDAIAAPLSHELLDVLPLARNKGAVGLDQMYEVQVGETPVVYRFAWQRMLAKGTYNVVYQGTITARRAHAHAVGSAAARTPLIINARRPLEDDIEPVVVRVTAQAETDLRIYLLENVINALLYALPETRTLVIPIRFAFKLPQNNNQVHRLGVVLSDPGHGHLGEWIENKCAENKQTALPMDTDMFAMLTSIAHMLYEAQRAVQLQHRDLRCDNIMWAPTDVARQTVVVEETGIHLTYLTRGVSCKFIDFGMARMVYRGEYIACDCMDTKPAFNRSHDLQNFCCTLVEDYAGELKAMSPKFFHWLSNLCRPVFECLPRVYANMTTLQRNDCLIRAAAESKFQPFVPSSMLAILKHYWERS